MEFFLSSAGSLYRNFDRLFQTPTEEDESAEGEETGDKRETQSTQRDNYDILPYALCYCKVANTPLDRTFETAATQVLTVVTYELQRIEEENKKLKRKTV